MLSLKRFFGFLLLFIVLTTLKVSAQSFETTVSKDIVSVSEYFQITFTISGGDLNSAKNFEAPDLSNFQIVGGPSQSSSHSWVNGKSSSSIGVSYYLQPKKEGRFTIGSATVEVSGRKLRSNAVTITATKGTTQGQRGNNGDNNVDMNEIAQNLYIAAVPDKTTVYQGEQVTVVYKIYTRLNMASPSISKLPTYKDFWTEDLNMPQTISLYRENVNGKPFTVGVLKRAALFPTRSGQLTITPFELKIPVVMEKRRQRNDPWGDVFDDPFFRGTQTVEYAARSNGVAITVLPIPENKDESFTGAVGNYTISLKIEKKKVKRNEPITLTIDVQGRGNLQLVQLPDFSLPQGLEKYDPDIKDQIERDLIVGGKKTFEYLLIPRTAGSQEIPAIKFTFFDPATASFKTVQTEAVTIDVSEESIDPAEVAGRGKFGDMVDKDIRYIKTDIKSIVASKGSFFGSFIYWFFFSLPLIALAILLIKKSKDDKLNSNKDLLRLTKARKMARKRLKVALKLLKAGKSEEFYLEISNALYGYLGDKLSLDKADFTIEKAVELMTVKLISETLVAEIKATLEKCDYIRFAPVQDVAKEMQGMYDLTSDLIVKLDEAIALKPKNEEVI